MKANYFVIDTFASTPFKGNPTGVCITPGKLSNELMLSIAGEFNFPVTAFIGPTAGTETSLPIKYFTPTTEITACGHATLASAKVIFDRESIAAINFSTIEDLVIKARLEGDKIMMTYPTYSLQTTEVSRELLECLGLEHVKSAGYSGELQTLFLEIERPAVLKDLKPDFKRLVASSNEIKEVVTTSESDIAEFDYLLRSFCPWIGIDEDPVTGSVHSVLGGFWQHRLKKNKLKAFQCSQRGGELFINAYTDKVELGGRAISILEGHISL